MNAGRSLRRCGLVAWTVGAAGGLLLLLIALVGTASPARADAAILRVPDDYPTIQGAIDAAQDGDEIRVQGGPDYEHPMFYQEHLTITKAITLSGSWSEDYSQQSFGNYPTVLDAEESGRVITIRGPVSTVVASIGFFHITGGNATGLGGWQTVETQPLLPLEFDAPGDLLTDTVESAGVLPATVPPEVDARVALLAELPALQRISPQPVQRAADAVIPVAEGQAVEVDCGGAIYSRNASLHLDHVMVADSRASTARDGYGGGICIVTAPYGGVMLQGNTIEDNQAADQGRGYGGGIFIADAPGAVLTHNDISGNQASLTGPGAGGGAYIAAEQVELSANGFGDNIASNGGDGFGGGLLLQSPAATVIGNVMVYNLASGGETGLGGGMALLASPGAEVTDNRFGDNLAGGGGRGVGGGLYVAESAAVHVADNAFEDNTAGSAPVIYGTGGGAYVRDSAGAAIRNNRFDRNLGSLYRFGLGGGLYLYRLPGASVQGNQFTRNWGAIYAAGGAGGGGLGLGEMTALTLTENLFASNVAVLYTGGKASGHGGGIYAVVVQDSLIASNTFTNNAGSWEGTGLGGGLSTSPDRNDNETARLRVANNLWTNNVATTGSGSASGGAIELRAVESQLVGNRFVANRLCPAERTCGGSGSAAYIHGFLLCRNITVDGNEFVRNATSAPAADAEGGVVRLFNVDTYTVTNNVLAGNIGGGEGALVLAVGSERVPTATSQSWVANNTIVGDTTVPGIAIEAGFADARLGIVNNILVSHTVAVTVEGASEAQASVRYNLFHDNGLDVGGEGVYTATANITGPPAFVDAANGDFHLLPTSVAIDAGDPAGIPPAPPADFDSFPRPFGPRVDIGAFEWHQAQRFLPFIGKPVPARSGWAVGDDAADIPAIVHTVDGGQTWVRQAGLPTWAGLDAADISAVDDQTAWAAFVSAPGEVRDAILHTVDGGATWISQTLPAGVMGGVKSIKGVSRTEAWASTLAGVVLHTVDGGATWAIVPHPDITMTQVNRLDVAGPHIWIADSADDGALVHSPDGGATWRREVMLNNGNAESPLVVQSPGGEVAWASGTESLSFFRTLDGGNAWEKVVTVGGFDHLDDVCASSTADAWGVQNGDGVNGKIHRVHAPVGAPVEHFDVTPAAMYGYTPGGVSCLDDHTAWVVAPKGFPLDPAKPRGLIFFTTGGDAWTQATAPADIAYWKISMVGAKR